MKSALRAVRAGRFIAILAAGAALGLLSGCYGVYSYGYAPVYVEPCAPNYVVVAPPCPPPVYVAPCPPVRYHHRPRW